MIKIHFILLLPEDWQQDFFFFFFKCGIIYNKNKEKNKKLVQPKVQEQEQELKLLNSGVQQYLNSESWKPPPN